MAFWWAAWCAVGLLRFAWAMRKKSRWKLNRQAQEAIEGFSPFTFLCVLVFEMFFWPIELLIGLHLLLRERRKQRAPTDTYLTVAHLTNNPMFREIDRKVRERVDDFIRKNPKCLKCGVEGHLSQYKESVWVMCSACGRRVFMPDPSVPEEIDRPPSVMQ